MARACFVNILWGLSFPYLLIHHYLLLQSLPDPTNFPHTKYFFYSTLLALSLEEVGYWIKPDALTAKIPTSYIVHFPLAPNSISRPTNLATIIIWVWVLWMAMKFPEIYFHVMKLIFWESFWDWFWSMRTSKFLIFKEKSEKGY